MPEAGREVESVVRRPSGWRFAPLALGACVAVFAWLSGNASVFPPELWDAVAAAAGIRPPATPAPGLWRGLAAGLFSWLGLAGGVEALRLAGPAALGSAAALAYLFLSEILPAPLRERLERGGRAGLAAGTVAALGALAFTLSQPVWRAGRVLSPEMLLLLLFLAALALLVHAVRTASPGAALAAAALSGLLAADTIFALLLPAVFAVPLALGFGASYDPEEKGLANPVVRFVAVRRMALVFAAAFAAAAAADAATFSSLGGFEATEWTVAECAAHWIGGHFRGLGAASPLGWVLVLSLVAGPLFLMTLFIRRAVDEDGFLPVALGAFYLASGLLALAQSGPWPELWFWRWGAAGDVVDQGLMLCLCIVCTAAAAVLAGSVLAVEFFVRDGGRVARTRFEDAVDGTDEAARTVASLVLWRAAWRVALRAAPAVALALLAAGKFSPVEREMAALVNAGARQAAEECGSAEMLFTDGSFDAAVEVAAAMEGRRLLALSMMAGAASWERHVWTRGETDEVERETLEAGAANALRTWVRARSARAADIALQAGLELWRRDRLPMPPVGGLVARTAGFPEGEAARRADEAKALAARVLELWERGGRTPDDSTDAGLSQLLSFLEWRLARMCRLRADAADAAGDVEAALSESALADALDARNAPLMRVQRQMEWRGLRMNAQLTPREGLELWLDRADFGTARSYAQRILKADPDDSRANFAMGMWYFSEGQYNRAEAHLARSLGRRPDDAAVLNNLAIVQARLMKYGEAETNATKALSLMPSAPEVRNTLEYVRRLRRGGAAAGGEPAQDAEAAE